MTLLLILLVCFIHMFLYTMCYTYFSVLLQYKEQHDKQRSYAVTKALNDNISIVITLNFSIVEC